MPKISKLKTGCLARMVRESKLKDLEQSGNRRIQRRHWKYILWREVEDCFRLWFPQKHVFLVSYRIERENVTEK